MLLSPSALSKVQSPALNNLLGVRQPAIPNPYSAVGSSYDVYSSVLAGVTKVPVPSRLDRTEAVGLVEMLQGYRGVREGASAHLSRSAASTNELMPLCCVASPSALSDQTFLEKYVASDGVPRHLRTLLQESSEA